MTHITLRSFSPRNLKPKTVLVFFGKRGSGKSFALQDIIYHMRGHFKEALVMSATEDGNHAWGAHVPTTFIHMSFAPEVLSRTLARQRERYQAWQETGGRAADCPHLLIVAEDLMAEDKKCLNNTDMRYIFMNGRHIGITFAMTVQYLMDLPRGLRMNIDYAFVLQDRSIGNIARMHESWAGTVCNLPTFRTIVQNCTENKGAMVIDINSDSSEISQVLYWYKARKRGAYRIGSREYWAFHFRYGKDKNSAPRPPVRAAGRVVVNMQPPAPSSSSSRSRRRKHKKRVRRIQK
jgi:hypothetical protein